MRRAVLAALSLALLAPAPAPAQAPRPAPAPVLVELFTAQGCLQCPAANAWAAQIAGRRNLVVLTYPVEYWDYLGWKDTLAQPAFAMRQRGYRTKLGLKDVYTPQFVIDGRREAAGNHLPGVLRLITDAERTRWYGPPLGIDRQRRVAAVGVGPSPPGGAEVWMARYDPRVITVRVRAGETRGAAVPHRNTVRELARLGPWTGQARVYPLPPPRARGLRTVVMVQGPGRYGVLAFARD